MPKAVANGKQPPAVIASEWLVVLIEIGNVGEGWGQTIFIRSAQTCADGELDRAQTLGEGQLLLVAKILIVENQHRIAVHARMDGLDIRRRQRLGQINAIDVSDKAGADLADGKGHDGILPRGWRAP